MRIVFIGTNMISLNTARSLIADNHEIIIIELNKERIDQLSDDLDCGFIHGDGSVPDTLQQVAPEKTDVLFCLTNNDKDNIIAGLVGRSLGFKKTIVKVEDFAYEHICTELGLEDVIVPTRTISRYLIDLILKRETSELKNVIKNKARFFTFVAGEEEKDKTAGELKLPKDAQVICYYRQDEFNLAGPESKLKEGDEVVILTHSNSLETLQERWPKKAES